jgi:hypothetical protein
MPCRVQQLVCCRAFGAIQPARIADRLAAADTARGPESVVLFGRVERASEGDDGEQEQRGGGQGCDDGETVAIAPEGEAGHAGSLPRSPVSESVTRCSSFTFKRKRESPEVAEFRRSPSESFRARAFPGRVDSVLL